VGGEETVANQRDRQMRNVNPDPLPVESLRDGHRRAAAAKGIEHHVALVAAGVQDAL